MQQKRRPISISVIGWTWIAIGGWMSISIFSVLISPDTMLRLLAPEPEAFRILPAILSSFTWFASIQFCLGLMGLTSGVGFLKLRPWSRNALEILSWGLLLHLAGKEISRIYIWLAASPGQNPWVIEIMSTATGVIWLGILAIPLGIMIRYLRANKVKRALAGSADFIDGHPASETAAGGDGDGSRPYVRVKTMICLFAGGIEVLVGAAYLGSIFALMLYNYIDRAHSPMIDKTILPGFAVLAFLAPMAVLGLLKHQRRVSRQTSILRLGIGAGLGSLKSGAALAALFKGLQTWSPHLIMSATIHATIYLRLLGLFIYGLFIGLGGALGTAIASIGMRALSHGDPPSAHGEDPSESDSQ